MAAGFYSIFALGFKAGINRTGPGGVNVTNTRRIFCVRLAHKSYEQVLAQRPDIRLDRLDPDGSDADYAPVLAAGHAYQINSSTDEVPATLKGDRNLLARCPNLLIMSTNGAGFDSVDIDACTQAGVLVVCQTGGNKEAVAEHVLGMLLTLSKRIVEADRVMRRDGIADRNDFIGNDAFGKTIGIVGLGNVGTRVAELCRLLLRMRVIACDPYLTAADIAARGAEKAELGDLLRQSDFVSINCPLTAETRGMIGAREFAAMRPHAYFITTARGFIHDEAALADALRAKRIAGAGIDVWMKEPPPRDHPLMQFDNVIVSPHTAGVTHEARENIGRIAAENLILALDGKRPARIVNPEVWPRYAARFEKIFGIVPHGAPAGAVRD